MCERCRDGGEAHIRAATIAAEGDDVDGLFLHLALTHERFQAGRRAKRGRAAAPQLGMHPWDNPGGAVVGGVSHVHTARAAEHDRARAGSLGHHLHHQRRFAALAGAVARGEELLERNLLLSLEWFELGKWIIDRCHRF